VRNDISLGTHISLGGPSSGRTGEDFPALELDQARIACIGLGGAGRNLFDGPQEMNIGRKCSGSIANALLAIAYLFHSYAQARSEFGELLGERPSHLAYIS
jgi:hypothetical protein